MHQIDALTVLDHLLHMEAVPKKSLPPDDRKCPGWQVVLRSAPAKTRLFMTYFKTDVIMQRVLVKFFCSGLVLFGCDQMYYITFDCTSF